MDFLGKRGGRELLCLAAENDACLSFQNQIKSNQTLGENELLGIRMEAEGLGRDTIVHQAEMLGV